MSSRCNPLPPPPPPLLLLLLLILFFLFLPLLLPLLVSNPNGFFPVPPLFSTDLRIVSVRNLRIAGDPCNAFALLNNTLVAGVGSAKVDYERPVTPCTVTLAARLRVPGLPWEAVSATFPVAVVDVNEAPVVVVTVTDVVEGSVPGTLVAWMEIVDPDVHQVQRCLSLLITDTHVRADTERGLCA